MAFAVGIMAVKARSPITNANASAQALDSRADDMRRPIPVSAGRNPADAAASCLTYLIIWSDRCPTTLDRGFEGHVSVRRRSSSGPQDLFSRSDRGRRPSTLEAREDVIGPPAPPGPARAAASALGEGAARFVSVTGRLWG